MLRLPLACLDLQDQKIEPVQVKLLLSLLPPPPPPQLLVPWPPLAGVTRSSSFTIWKRRFLSGSGGAADSAAGCSSCLGSMGTSFGLSDGLRTEEQCGPWRADQTPG